MAYRGQNRIMNKQNCAAFLVSCTLICSGCREPERSGPTENNSAQIQNPNSANEVPNFSNSTTQTSERKKQFSKMQESMHAVASIASSQKGAAYDFHFVLPSDNWEKISHGVGDQKSSIWLFN
ncbi:MAG: hypothetical protein WCI55_08330 [Armatimonadota bacterium]